MFELPPEISAILSVNTLALLPVLTLLEVILSADNAIALAALTRGLNDIKLERRALNLGLLLAYGLRIMLILVSTWVIRFWQFEVAGALYLLWLVFQYFSSDSETSADHHHHGPRFVSIWQAAPIIALTDLAFSLDSVASAVAVSRDVGVILLGATIGIVALRFMAGLFIRWLDEFVNLEDAGYLTILLVAVRMLLRVSNEALAPPDWLMLILIGQLFVWGFAERNLDRKATEKG